jgi:tyrosyl-tRNA synthetase
MILFNGTLEDLANLSEELFLDVFNGVPQFEIAMSEIEQGISLVEFVTGKVAVFPSKNEAKKMIQSGGVAINKNKVDDLEFTIDSSTLINNKYILVQKGKKNYFVVKVV